jgi:ArsR family transcriptional regulator
MPSAVPCCSTAELLELRVDPLDGARVAELAKALSDPVRVQIVSVLRRVDGELCQCDLAPLFQISQSTLSHHMKKLQEAGLVSVSRRSKWAFYALEPTALEELHAWLS